MRPTKTTTTAMTKRDNTAARALNADESKYGRAALRLFKRRLADIDPDGLTPIAEVAARCDTAEGRLAAGGPLSLGEANVLLEAAQYMSRRLCKVAMVHNSNLSGAEDALGDLRGKLLRMHPSLDEIYSQKMLEEDDEEEE